MSFVVLRLSWLLDCWSFPQFIGTVPGRVPELYPIEYQMPSQAAVRDTPPGMRMNVPAVIPSRKALHLASLSASVSPINTVLSKVSLTVSFCICWTDFPHITHSEQPCSLGDSASVMPSKWLAIASTENPMNDDEQSGISYT